MSRRLLAVLVILTGAFVVVPVAWIGTAVIVILGAWVLDDRAGLDLPILHASVAVPVGMLCGMGAGFLSALGSGIVARGLLRTP
jgi:hypothetical protein